MEVKGPRPHGLGSAFSALLSATFVTNIGDGMRLAALPLLATTLTSSPLVISGITAAQFLPWTTFAPFGGVIVDRSDRRRLIMATQTWRSLVMALLWIAVLTEAVQVWHLFVVAFVITVGEILVDPSIVATVPTLVAKADLDRANGRISTVEITTNDFAGGPIGAASFGLAPWLPFLLDSLTYLGSVPLFGRLPAAPSKVADKPNLASVRIEAGEGLRWIGNHSFLRPFTFALAVYYLGTAAAFSLLVLLVTDVLEARNIIFGLVLSGAAIGATAASLAASRLTDRLSRRIVMTGAAAIAAASVIAASAVSNEWQLIAVWSFNGAAGGLLLSVGRGFVQRHTPNDRLGRTAIASRMITRTSFVVGAVFGGLIADSTSVRWSFLVAGLLHLVGAALVWRSFRHEPA